MVVEAIIQARMGSSRLRGKSLMPLAGIPLLKRVIDTVKRNDFITGVTVATSTLTEDDPIEAYCAYLGAKCVRGDSKDVLSRFIKAAEDLQNGDQVIRVTADNPFNRHDVSAFLFKQHISGSNDYTYVDGLSHIAYENINVGALRKVWAQPDLNDYHKEHVTPYFRDNRDRFKLLSYDNTIDGLNPTVDKLLTVDSPDDHKRIEQMIIDIKYDTSPELNFNKIYKWLEINYTDKKIETL
ncbi:cytidylyltransferase domain-containing protein [Mucilaginibacter lutimaris]|uniref:Cytidylyltransferase domain-containing protein n=1 Tax=Mucilaginibacter lutimaris TaxID=931629 RepID=A0ABW2ZC84_9SPHI